MGRKDDPDMAPDAALAIEDTPERQAEQLAALGGEHDDIDDFDPAGLDDGSNLDFTPEGPKDEEAAGEDTPADEGADDAKDPAVDPEEDADGDNDDPDEPADEAKADDDAEEDPAPEPKEKGIPKHRFDEVNEEKKALRRRVEELEAKERAAQDPAEAEDPFDFKESEKKYMELMLDGDVDGALAAREEIDAAKEAKWRSAAKTETVADLDASSQRQELQSLFSEAETMFDAFNPKHESYDQGKIDKVLVFMAGYEASGEMTRGDAFVAGLADVVDMYDMMPEDEPEPEPKPKPKDPKKDPKKEKLAEEAPKPVGNAGRGSAEHGAAVPSIDDMSDEELEALPEKTLARMRGDFFG